MYVCLYRAYYMYMYFMNSWSNCACSVVEKSIEMNGF